MISNYMRILNILLALGLLTAQVYAQDLPSLFKFTVDKYNGAHYVTFEPDSTPSDTALRPRCAALWHYHDYLYQNYANASMKSRAMGALHSDADAIRSEFRRYMEEDTAFTRMYLRSLGSERIAPLHIDSALRIASHFYYVHRDQGKPTVHFCIGINKVKELGDAYTHPHHAAFCYMALWAMDDGLELYMKVRGPFSEEVRKGVSDERLSEIEQEVYKRISALPELREALVQAYLRKKPYMNFELIR